MWLHVSTQPRTMLTNVRNMKVENIYQLLAKYQALCSRLHPDDLL